MPKRSPGRTVKSPLLNSSASSWFRPMYSSMPPDTPFRPPCTALLTRLSGSYREAIVMPIAMPAEACAKKNEEELI
jgi:hypothetical protein